MDELPRILTVELTKLDLQPGDVLAARVVADGPLTQDDASELSAMLVNLLPAGVRGFLYDGRTLTVEWTRVRPPTLFDLPGDGS